MDRDEAFADIVLDTTSAAPEELAETLRDLVAEELAVRQRLTGRPYTRANEADAVGGRKKFVAWYTSTPPSQRSTRGRPTALHTR